MAQLPNYFAAGAIDRAGHRRRDEDWLKQRLADPASRLLRMPPGQVPVDADGRLMMVDGPHDVEGAGGVIFLGIDEHGRATFAVDAGDDSPGPFMDLRGAAMFLGSEEANRAAYASAMLTWHRRHRWCGACGHPTAPDWAGHLRLCAACGAEHFPRTDPVMIVLVAAGEHVLLGRQPSWPPGMWSALAGFVEPGESLEDAVRREVREEAGVPVTDVQYHSSQPWPFPLSLMVGFTASAGPVPVDVAVDHSELDDARWFTAEEIAGVMLPPPFSIARQLVETWLSRS
ncbi:MAG TPA: NAD(+) diphosphatase [Acidimicrobiales bacterium]|nr:NAD(+) diphosphatase [Acidimicrobiales bacterium]